MKSLIAILSQRLLASWALELKIVDRIAGRVKPVQSVCRRRSGHSTAFHASFHREIAVLLRIHQHHWLQGQRFSRQIVRQIAVVDLSFVDASVAWQVLVRQPAKRRYESVGEEPASSSLGFPVATYIFTYLEPRTNAKIQSTKTSITEMMARMNDHLTEQSPGLYMVA